MNEHEFYEILCAAAASGRVSRDELQQLALHARECGDCRERLRDFAQLSAQVLPFYGDTYCKPSTPSGMTARFVDRARSEGIPLRARSRVVNFSAIPGLAWVSAVTALVLISILLFKNTHIRNPEGTRVASPRQVVAAPAQSKQEQAIEAATGDDEQRIKQLSTELASARWQIEGLREQITALRQQLTDSNSAKENAASRLTKVEAENTALRLDASAKDSRMADLDRQIKQKESLASEQVASVVEKQEELEKLSKRLAERERDLAHERQILAASAQARDLITARNLHIIDVHDNDRSGRQRPFGRIFYTEGQSLIFYAYDLNTADNDTKVAFHVWGGTLGDQRRVMNLGIFRSEDTVAGRWVLAFDDPHVMTQINTVFVTAESANNLDQPKGKRILFAFLGDRPNHP